MAVRPADAERSAAARAGFLVSPGRTPRLRAAMAATGLPFLPGVATASEAIALLADGITAMKFFPAEAAGGTSCLKPLAGPLPRIRFCPAGGIGRRNAADHLALENVG